MDSFGQFFRCVVFEDFGAGLEDDVAAVVLFVYVVNGDARFLFAGFDHGTVYVHAVHAFAPVGWQQGGVDVDDALFVPAGDLGRYQAEKSGQDDEVDLVFLQFFQDFSAVQILPEKTTVGTEYLAARSNTRARGLSERIRAMSAESDWRK